MLFLLRMTVWMSIGLYALYIHGALHVDAPVGKPGDSDRARQLEGLAASGTRRMGTACLQQGTACAATVARLTPLFEAVMKPDRSDDGLHRR